MTSARRGLHLEQVDRLAKSMAWWYGRQVLPQRLAEAGFDPDNGKVALLMPAWPRRSGWLSAPPVAARRRFCDCARQASQLVPIENAAMAERTVIQRDKDDLDALGLLKVDALALGMLSAIRRALDLVSARAARPSRWRTFPRRSGGVRHDRPCRYGGRVPDRVPRADGHAAAHEATPFL